MSKDSIIYSSKSELDRISSILSGYLMLPFAAGDSIPGNLMEHVFSNVRSSEVLNTYDYIDVLDSVNKLGWQVKSTKESTPLTWKRAKIADKEKLIKASQESPEGLQKLGDTIIAFCNKHAQESFDKYDLDEIGYSRLIVHPNKSITYYEKLLCTKEKPEIFDSSDFSWCWSTPKETKGKEQLHALHGTYKDGGEKAFAWHGLGENQLHFSGEKNWWPKKGEHSIKFNFPKKRLSQGEFMELLESFL